MKTLANVINANKVHITWKNQGIKKAQEFNKSNSTNWIHDVDLLGDYINELPKDKQLKLLDPNTIALLNIEIPNVKTKPRLEEYRTYSAIYTYVLYMLVKKFGTDAVTTDNTLGFRGILNSSKIKDYARDLMKITVDRITL